MKFFLVTLLSLLVVSCSTSSMKSDDFASLSKYERARLVCSSTDSHQARANQLSVLSEQIDTQNAILKSGMRRWTSCRMVNESECAICTPKLVNRCTDGAVPIDSDYEAKVRDDYVAQYESIKSVDDAEMRRCSQLVLEMPISESYGLYLSGLDPVGNVTSGISVEETPAAAASTSVAGSANGSRPKGYAGQMKGGSRYGVGTQSYDNGDKYYGDWRDDVQHGDGTYFFKDGRVYEGTWKNGKLDGYVVQTFVNGEVYEGFMREGEYHGYGVLTCADGSAYDFEYENDKLISGTFCPKP